MSDQALIRLVNVSKIYEQGEIQVTALSNVSLEIESGSFLSLCGPSGSGKTTLLNLIGGLDRATEGSVAVDGVKMEDLSNSQLADLRLHKLGFVFQAYNLIPVLSAVENVEFVMQLQGIEASERRARAEKIMAEVGLEGLLHRRPSELSGGQQQRVAVARAMVSNPKLVLADEPTANLDSKTAESLLELMLHMNKEHGSTFVFSTHDKLVMQYARRLVKLKDGRIEEDQL